MNFTVIALTCVLFALLLEPTTAARFAAPARLQRADVQQQPQPNPGPLQQRIIAPPERRKFRLNPAAFRTQPLPLNRYTAPVRTTPPRSLARPARNQALVPEARFFGPSSWLGYDSYYYPSYNDYYYEYYDYPYYDDYYYPYY